jgi:hypothetical protein
VAKERLSELVFPGEADVQADAIEVVVYRLRKKLAATTAPTLVTLRGLGYLLKDGANLSRRRPGWRHGHGRMSLRRYLLLGILVPVLAVVGINTASLYRPGPGRSRHVPTTARCWRRPRPSANCWKWPRAKARPGCVPPCPTARWKPLRPTTAAACTTRCQALAARWCRALATCPPCGRPLISPGLRRAGALLRRQLPRPAGARGGAAAAGGGPGGQGMAVIQVAETLELRRTLARRLLIETLWRQAVLVA